MGGEFGGGGGIIRVNVWLSPLCRLLEPITALFVNWLYPQYNQMLKKSNRLYMQNKKAKGVLVPLSQSLSYFIGLQDGCLCVRYTQGEIKRKYIDVCVCVHTHLCPAISPVICFTMQVHYKYM